MLRAAAGEIEGRAADERRRVEGLIGGRLESSDRPLLVAWCRAVAIAEIAVERMQAGLVSSSADHIPSAWLTIYNRAVDQQVKLSERFGFTPYDRARLKIEPDALPDEFEETLA